MIHKGFHGSGLHFRALRRRRLKFCSVNILSWDTATRLCTGQHFVYRPNFAPKLGDYGHFSALVNSRAILADFGRCWPVWCDSGQMLVDIGRLRADFDPSMAQFDRILSTAASASVELGTTLADFGFRLGWCWPTSFYTWADSARIRYRSTGVDSAIPAQRSGRVAQVQ